MPGERCVSDTVICYNIAMPEDVLTLHRVDTENYAAAVQEMADSSAEPLSFLQSPLYGRLQSQDGKPVVYFIATKGDVTIACGLAVKYTAPLGMSFLYCPYGPVSSGWSKEFLQALRLFFVPIARELDCAFLRIDPLNEQFDALARPVPNRLAKTASLQPRAEWLLDIRPSEEELWMSFHKHARYNVRLAERANAQTTVYTPTEAPLDSFFELMQTTAGRDGFGIFDKSYYQAYLSAMSPDDGFVIITSIDGKPAAAALFVVYDKQAHYVFAGSSDDFRKIAPAYTVIWAAIKEARRCGCELFNFGGIIDDVKSQDLGGVTGFKRRFGGCEAKHANPVDIPLRKLRYLLFKLYKTIR